MILIHLPVNGLIRGYVLFVTGQRGKGKIINNRLNGNKLNLSKVKL